MHDGASPYSVNATKKWLSDNDVNVLGWPARSPALKIIQNPWAWLAKHVYEDQRQYNSAEELTDVIHQVWLELADVYVKNLFKSIPDRLVAVIETKGAMTGY